MDEQPKQIQPERVSLSTAVVNEVLSIFGSMPFNQVNGIIQKIQQDVKPIIETAPETKPQDEAEVPTAGV